MNDQGEDNQPKSRSIEWFLPNQPRHRREDKRKQIGPPAEKEWRNVVEVRFKAIKRSKSLLDEIGVQQTNQGQTVLSVLRLQFRRAISTQVPFVALDLLVKRISIAIAIRHDDLIERSEEHTSELQSRRNLVCRLLLEKKKRHTFTRPFVVHAHSSTTRTTCT